MVQVFVQVVKIKVLLVEQVIQFGFYLDVLEVVDEFDQVCVLVWCYVLVNFDYLLLCQGLWIFDMFGLNVFGSELELILLMLFNVQVILFLLFVDVGVIVLDMEIWQKYIQLLCEDGYSSLFVVLNKIDVFWDDFFGECFVQNVICLIQDGMVCQFGLQCGDVLLLLVKQVLLVKVCGELVLFECSCLDWLEVLFCECIVVQKEVLLENVVFGQVFGLLYNSQYLLCLCLEKVEEQCVLFDDKQCDSG